MLALGAQEQFASRESQEHQTLSELTNHDFVASPHHHDMMEGEAAITSAAQSRDFCWIRVPFGKVKRARSSLCVKALGTFFVTEHCHYRS